MFWLLWGTVQDAALWPLDNLILHEKVLSCIAWLQNQRLAIKVAEIAARKVRCHHTCPLLLSEKLVSSIALNEM